MNERLEELLSHSRSLVSLPDVYLEVKRILESPLGNASELARAVSTDAALTARFLRIANSPLFAPRSEIATVSRAITLLGTQIVHDIVLAASVADVFAGMDPKVMDVQRYWRTSFECGVLAKDIAGDVGVLDSDHVFVEGLLADIGHMVMYQREPALMQELTARALVEQRPRCDLEREALGFDYCEVGACLAADWRLPEALVAVIAQHQRPAEAAAFTLETAIVHVAYRLARCEPDTLPELDEAAVTLTGCAPARAAALRAVAQGEIDTTLAAFGPLAQAA